MEMTDLLFGRDLFLGIAIHLRRGIVIREKIDNPFFKKKKTSLNLLPADHPQQTPSHPQVSLEPPPEFAVGGPPPTCLNVSEFCLFYFL